LGAPDRRERGSEGKEGGGGETEARRILVRHSNRGKKKKRGGKIGNRKEDNTLTPPGPGEGWGGSKRGKKGEGRDDSSTVFVCHLTKPRNYFALSRKEKKKNGKKRGR